ncbi:MAG: hypothetical protein K2G93_02135 [Rikenella sp.]|nr:hypothetical protein [Rikenella sp.]
MIICLYQHTLQGFRPALTADEREIDLTEALQFPNPLHFAVLWYVVAYFPVQT